MCYIAVGSLLFYYCNSLDVNTLQRFFAETGATALPAATQTTAKAFSRIFSALVKSGDTFAGLLAKGNVANTDISSYYALLKSSGFPALFPGDSIVVEQEENSRNTVFSLLSRSSYWYRLYQTDSTLHLERQPLEVTKHICVIKGTLQTSLSEDMSLAGGDEALVYKFTDIFAWDINFFVDPRPGDRFEVLFEKLYREGKFAGYGNILAAKYVTRNFSYYAVGIPDANGRMSYYDNNGKSVQKDFLKAPLRLFRISSKFTYGRRHPIYGVVRPHLGVDYAAPAGTPVYSAADGIVAFAGFKQGFGNTVEISHGGSYQTMYGHLQGIAAGIHQGVHVAQGTVIGKVGSTGIATGPHLDYRMKIGSTFVNPLTVNIPSKKGVSREDMDLFTGTRDSYLFTLDARVKEEGCFVIEIKTEEPSEIDLSRSIILTNAAYGTTPRS